MVESIFREVEVKYKVIDRKNRGKINLNSPQKVFEYFKPVFENECQEKFIVACLNNKNNLQGWICVSIGTVSETIVHPREVFKSAINMNSSSIIILHNHPSGVLTPSQDDIKTTNRLVEGGKILGIDVLDHVIITDEDFFSLNEEGYI